MAIAFVGSTTATSISNAAIAVTYSPTAGNAVFVFCNWYVAGNGGTVAVTDNSASTYTADIQGSEGPFLLTLHRCLSVNSGVTTITATPSQTITAEPAIIVLEFSGVASFDQVTAQKASTTVSSAGSTNALTPAVTGELSLGHLFQSTNNSAWSGTNGWTAVTKTDSNGNELGAIYKVISGTASTTATFSIPAGDVNYWAYQAMYTPSGGATSKLFTPGSLNGLGTGGAFFHDRLA